MSGSVNQVTKDIRLFKKIIFVLEPDCSSLNK